MNPDCPKCRADGDRHVELVTIIVYDRTHRIKTDYVCKVCAFDWSIVEGDDERKQLRAG